MKTVCSLGLVAVTTAAFAFDELPPEPKDVPALMVTESGKPVTSVADWENVRRPEVFRTMMEGVYGVRPVERPSDLRFEQVGETETVYDGTALKKICRGFYSGPGGSESFEFTAWIPKREGKVASIVYISPRAGRTVDDLNVDPRTYTVPMREILARGYALVAFKNYEFALDIHGTPTKATNGVFRAFGPQDAANRKPTEWGILSAWAWGASRMVDWIETEPLLDAKRVGVVGLSRNGKASLLAGVTDPRFGLTVSCCSGMGGSKLNHIDCFGSESVELIMKPAWRWFCADFKRWIKRDREMPFDQHWQMALVAPRLLYISSASEDHWAGQRGEFASACLATPVWNLYGKAGLVQRGFPKPDMPLHAGNVAYHLRSGQHDITPDDWRMYLDFADGHGWNLPAK